MHSILVPIDFSDVTERVVSSAEQMAKALDGRIILLHCVNNEPSVAAMGEVPFVLTEPSVPAEQRFPEQKRMLARWTATLRNRGVRVESQIVVGAPAKRILAEADHHEVEVIIMGSHGHGGIYELLVGSVTRAVLRHSRHAVLVIPSESHWKTSQNPLEEPAPAIAATT